MKDPLSELFNSRVDEQKQKEIDRYLEGAWGHLHAADLPCTQLPLLGFVACSASDELTMLA